VLSRFVYRRDDDVFSSRRRVFSDGCQYRRYRLRIFPAGFLNSDRGGSLFLGFTRAGNRV
jgi:hypothetical protein